MPPAVRMACPALQASSLRCEPSSVAAFIHRARKSASLQNTRPIVVAHTVVVMIVRHGLRGGALVDVVVLLPTPVVPTLLTILASSLLICRIIYCSARIQPRVILFLWSSWSLPPRPRRATFSETVKCSTCTLLSHRTSRLSTSLLTAFLSSREIIKHESIPKGRPSFAVWWLAFAYRPQEGAFWTESTEQNLRICATRD